MQIFSGRTVLHTAFAAFAPVSSIPNIDRLSGERISELQIGGLRRNAVHALVGLFVDSMEKTVAHRG